MSTATASRSKTLEGRFQHLIYSPRGEIEGVLMHVGEQPAQLVFEHAGEPAAASFIGLAEGDVLGVKARPEPPSHKGEAAHAVYRFERLVSVNGGQPAAPADEEPGYQGTVARLNYARHGEANGVVLDSGHFIHTKPHGMAALGLAVGDKVVADGDARPLVTGEGWAVEATVVNGQEL